MKLLLLVMLFISVSCRNADKVGPSLPTYEDGSRPDDVVMASKEYRPLWTDDVKQWVKEKGEKGKVYFAGSVERRGSRNSALEEARLEGQVAISNTLANVVTESMAKTSTGPTVVSPGASRTEIFEFVQRRLGRKTKNVISGAAIADEFWWERKDDHGTFFDAWTLFSMDETVYRRALNTAVMEIMPSTVAGKKATQEILQELDTATGNSPE